MNTPISAWKAVTIILLVTQLIGCSQLSASTTALVSTSTNVPTVTKTFIPTWTPGPTRTPRFRRTPGATFTPVPTQTVFPMSFQYFNEHFGVGDVQFSADGGTLAVMGGERGTDYGVNGVWMWNMNNMESNRSFIGFDGRLFHLRQDGKEIALWKCQKYYESCGDGFVYIVDTATGSTTKTLPTKHGTLLQIEFSPDGKYLAYVSELSGLILVDAQSGKELYARPIWFDDRIAFSPDNRFLAIFDSGRVDLISLTDFKITVLLGTQVTSAITSVSGAFLPDGKTLVANQCVSIGRMNGCEENTIYLWDLQTAVMTKDIHISADKIFASNNGKIFAISTTYHDSEQGIYPQTVLWQIKSGIALMLLNFKGKIMTISPDGSLAVVKESTGIRFIAIPNP